MREPTPQSTLGQSLREAGAEARHRELAVEHLLFQALGFLGERHPELLDRLEGSIANLGDHADDETKDDEAVRDVARRIVRGLRRARA